MRKKIPTSSYRIQLSPDFTFFHAKNILPYIKKLGIEMVYTSPFFSYAKGSNNPYMITSPLTVEEELGGQEAFESFCEECNALGLQVMMDIVPNHMAASKDNAFFQDVVENKRESIYADFFDIDWEYGKGEVVYSSKENIHEKINYRRFFDICDMICLRIEKTSVYEWYFFSIKEYVNKGLIHGFRIDHIDGLKYPKSFLDKVHQDFPDLYISLEKIVQKGEFIPKNFACDGSVGYEMLFCIDRLFVDPKTYPCVKEVYNQYKEEDPNIASIKIAYLDRYLISEVNRFSSMFGVSKDELKVFLAHFPVYRSYVDDQVISSADKEAILHAASFTKGTFFKKEIFESKHREALVKLQQILPAVFAKGYEDTYLYRDVMLTGLNEVGGDLDTYALTNEEFFSYMTKMHELFPSTMHTLSTHDTKRSLDARMRTYTLAEMDFSKIMHRWMELTPPFSSTRVMYLFFQSLIAMSEENRLERITSYMIKACREGKYYSDHLEPNVEFEDRLTGWIETILANQRFMIDFEKVKRQVDKQAMQKSISALVLQIGLFGMMDVYQGEELQNANLVDPDNRREVDFAKREELLEKCDCLKMNILYEGLILRKKYTDLIQQGSFEKVDTKEGQIGYKRVYKDQELIVMVNKTIDLEPLPNCLPGFTAVLAENLPFAIYIKGGI